MFSSISTQANELINLTKKDNYKTKTKLITIASGKGGIGKTTFTGNIAYLLSSKGFKVAIIDADIGLANMQVLLNIKPKNTLFDYINGKVTIEEVLLKTSYENLSLIAGGSGHEYSNYSNSFIFSRVAQEVINLNRFDIVLVDTGAGLSNYVKEFLIISDNILAITTTDPSALTDLYALIKMLCKDNKQHLMLCFNHTKNNQVGNTISNSLMKLIKKNKLNDDFTIEYIGSLPTSENISKTSRLRKLFTYEFENSKSTKQLKEIVNSLI